MSLISIILAYVFNFLISPFGLISFGLGLILFFSLPVVSKATPVKKPAKFMFWLGKQPIRRIAIVVSEHNDIYFKRMQFSDLGLEQIKIGDETKDFEDPDSASHYWMGKKFALADEKHGVLFDPRHAAIGKREHEAREKGELEYMASDEEWSDNGVTRWMRGFYEFPKNHEIVNLSFVRELIDGGERAEYGGRVEERYKNSRDQFKDKPGMSQLLVPIIALIAPFAAMWFFATQGSSGGGSVVGYGNALLMAAMPDRDIREILEDHWKKLVGGFAGLLLFAITVIVLLSFGGVFFALSFLWTALWGALFLPMLAFATKPIQPIAGPLSGLFFKLGMLGYTRPVLEWTPSTYRLKEASNLNHENDPTWYNLFGGIIGFTFEPQEESWGAEVMPHDDIESRQVATDGGETESKLPERYSRTNTLQRANYGLFMPRRLKRRCYYLNAGIALSRFNDSAVGEKSHKRLQKAKDVHGEGTKGMSQRSLIILSAALGLVSFVSGILVFFVL